MKIFQNVRSTAINIPTIEVNVDTVYVRSSIIRIEEMEFSGWEYDEIQYPLRDYIAKLMNAEVGQLIIAQNTSETLELMTILNEQAKVEQAQSNAELIELILSMTGGM